MGRSEAPRVSTAFKKPTFCPAISRIEAELGAVTHGRAAELPFYPFTRVEEE